LSENLRKLHSIYDSAKNKESKHSVRISLKINEIERRIVNIRKDYLHKVSKFIVKLAIDGDMSSIIIDDISSNNIVKGRNKWINKSIYNNAFSILKFNIKYNTEIANKSYNKNINVVLADPSYSSQICPVCLNHKKKSLDEREHICEKCGIRIDRDLSSAILMDKVNSSRQLPTGVDQIRTFDKVFEDLIL
jgi:putative transposase